VEARREQFSICCAGTAEKVQDTASQLHSLRKTLRLYSGVGKGPRFPNPECFAKVEATSVRRWLEGLARDVPRENSLETFRARWGVKGSFDYAAASLSRSSYFAQDDSSFGYEAVARWE
jgi:hypothetical protein